MLCSDFQIRLHDIKNGLPHHLPLNTVIPLRTDNLGDNDVSVPYTGMTASRLMIFASAHPADVLVVWDWRIGDIVRAIDFRLVPILIPSILQVLKWSSTRYNFLHNLSSKLVFIDEFRLLATTGVPVGHVCELSLVMFDTSIPQQYPDDRQPFDLEPTDKLQRMRNLGSWEVSVHTDSVRARGESSCDGPLVIDPTQSVVVIAFNEHGAFKSWEALLVIRTTVLVGYTPSTRTCRRILWNEWKRDAMVVKVPRCVSYIRPHIIGSRVLLMTCNFRDPRHHYRVQAYDFGLWGCKALIRAGRGKKRRLMPNPKESWFPHGYSNWVWNMRVLGDSIVSCVVSNSLKSRAHRWLTSGARRTISFPVKYMSCPGVGLVEDGCVNWTLTKRRSNLA